MQSSSLNHAERGAHLLIVDDEQFNVTTLVRILQHAGYPLCTGTNDPHAAVSCFLENRPDLLVLDWHMGDHGGLEIVNELRECIPAENMPPILVMTGDQSPETRREALAAGATDFLAKPLDYSEMLLRIHNLLQIRMLQQQALHLNQRLEEQVRERTARLELTITELTTLQQQIIRQERLRALGAMAGGIAHDFNNALMVMRGYSELFTVEPERCSEPGKVLVGFQAIGTAARDAAEIVRRLREFYRPYDSTEGDRRPVNLNRLVEEAARLSQPIWQTQMQAVGIQVELTFALSEVPAVPASEA